MCSYCHATDHKTADCEQQRQTDEKKARAEARLQSRKYANIQGAWKYRPAGATIATATVTT